jgi:DNA-binding phage protein
MAKIATSKKPKKSARKYLRVFVPFSSPEMRDPHFVNEVLLDCIKDGDVDSFRNVLFSFLMTANKAELARKSGIGRRTLYDLIDTKKKFNPELSTVIAVMHAMVA